MTEETGAYTVDAIKDICIPGVGVFQTVADPRTAYEGSDRGFDVTDDTCNVYSSFVNEQ